MRMFEVEDRTEYYNSYTDRIITGSMLPNGQRGQVGSVVSGSWEWQGETRYSSLIYKYYNQFFRSGMVNCTFGTIKDEYFNCTIPPDFREITKLNGGKFVAPKLDEITVNNSAITNPTQPFDTKLLKLFLSYTGTITGSDGAQISDNRWWYDYPFSQRYAAVHRLPNISKADSLAIYEEYLNSGLVHYRPVTEVTSSNNYVICISSGSNAVGSTVRWLNSYDKTVSVNPTVPTFNLLKTTGLSEIDFTKIYFGHKPNYVTIVATIIPGQGIYGYNFGATIKGFKYGLMNATRLKQKLAFNRNHFGFRSDMLEQGIYGTTWNEQTGQLYKPITVSFTSGTVSAFSASNPVLNVTGNGLFDYEYKVGLPFTEVI